MSLIFFLELGANSKAPSNSPFGTIYGNLVEHLRGRLPNTFKYAIFVLASPDHALAARMVGQYGRSPLPEPLVSQL